jgi:glucose-6-phosphate isomerase
MIKTDLKLCLAKDDLENAKIKALVAANHRKIFDANGQDNKWTNLPNSMRANADRIKKTAAWVRKNADVLVVIGIGGSFTGATAGLEMVAGKADFPIEFLGTGFNAGPIENFIKKYEKKRVAVNVISKSGTTLEIVAAFNVIDSFMRKKYSAEDYKKRVIITTGPKGWMRDFANAEGIEPFEIPDGVGGRYSVLSAVGLLPFAVAGLDIDAMLDGAAEIMNGCQNLGNDAYRYAVARWLLHAKQKKAVEVLANFHGLAEIGAWWQQLFGESEGKEKKGLFPSPMIFSTALHSMGQFIQQGSPVLFETFINVEKEPADAAFTASKSPALSTGVSKMTDLNRAAYLGTVKAHSDAKIPVISLNVPDTSEKSFGALVYFFEVACAMSAYLLGVNPFDQPGVEEYKREMRKLL